MGILWCRSSPHGIWSNSCIERKKLLRLRNWKINDLDLIESNEAFAAQSLAVIKELKIPENIVNVNGGASFHQLL